MKGCNNLHVLVISAVCPTVERRRRARLRRGPDGADAVVVRPAGPVQGRHHDLGILRGRRLSWSRIVAKQRLRPKGAQYPSHELGSGVVLGAGMQFIAVHIDVNIDTFPGHQVQ